MELKTQGNYGAFIAEAAAKRGRTLPTSFARSPHAAAVVDDGRWIAHCTNDDCRGAVLVDPNDLRMFCLSCGNDHVDGKWIHIDWPDNAVEVEKSLEGAPHWRQFWKPDA